MFVVLSLHCSPSKLTVNELRMLPDSLRIANPKRGSVDAPCETTPSARSDAESAPKEYKVRWDDKPELALIVPDVEYHPGNVGLTNVDGFTHVWLAPEVGRLLKFCVYTELAVT